MSLFIYKISQTQNHGYDTYDSAVVIAKNDDAAARIHPDGKTYWNGEHWVRDYPASPYFNTPARTERASYHGWCAHIRFVDVELISELVLCGCTPSDYAGLEGTVVLASFNAGK